MNLHSRSSSPDSARQDAPKETRLDLVVGRVSLGGEVREGRHGQPGAAKRGQRSWTRANACPQQGVLQIEDNLALGASRHQVEQAWHFASRRDLHRPSASGAQGRRRDSSWDHQVLVAYLGECLRLFLQNLNPIEIWPISPAPLILSPVDDSEINRASANFEQNSSIATTDLRRFLDNNANERKLERKSLRDRWIYTEREISI